MNIIIKPFLTPSGPRWILFSGDDKAMFINSTGEPVSLVSENVKICRTRAEANRHALELAKVVSIKSIKSDYDGSLKDIYYKNSNVLEQDKVNKANEDSAFWADYLYHNNN